MWVVRATVLLVGMLVAGCATPSEAYRRGERALERGAYREAAAAFDDAAARAKEPTFRAEALTRAALACEKSGDVLSARARLEQAVSPELAGSSEPALYYLAQLVEKEDQARALSLYYRAAAGAAQHRDKQFPYAEATARILQLSMQR